MSKKNKKKDESQLLTRNNSDNYLAGVMIILMLVVPLLMRATIVDFTAPRIIDTILNTGRLGDVFSYYKWIVLISGAGLALILLSDKIILADYQIAPSYINAPLLILVVLLLLSVLAAEYKSMALFGLYSQRDGALTLLAYLALCFTAANTVFKPWFSRAVTAILMALLAINAVITIFYFAGIFLMENELFRSLIAPKALRGVLGGSLGSTLGHANYMSGLAAGLFAYFFAGVLLVDRWRPRLLWMLGAVTSFVIILASLSSSGFVTLLIITPLLIASAGLSQDIKGTVLTGGTTLLVCMMVFLLMNSYNPRVYNETLGFVFNALGIETRTAQAVEVEPEPAANTPAAELNGSMAVPDSSAQFSQSIRTVGLAELNNTSAEPGKAEESETEAADSFLIPQPAWAAGTGRVYIWAKTWELIQERPMLGYGPGTLPYYFPHNDIDKIAGLNSYGTLVSKPHNIYLGMAYGSGIPALLALLALFLLHFYHTGRYLWRAKRSQDLVFPAALFLFFCTFTVQGLFNDAVIGAGAVFWCLLGVGTGLNQQRSPRIKD